MRASLPSPTLTPTERERVERTAKWRMVGPAYSSESRMWRVLAFAPNGRCERLVITGDAASAAAWMRQAERIRERVMFGEER